MSDKHHHAKFQACFIMAIYNMKHLRLMNACGLFTVVVVDLHFGKGKRYASKNRDCSTHKDVVNGIIGGFYPWQLVRNPLPSLPVHTAQG